MGSISVPAGELAALREEARMAHKWAKEVRRLEEQLLAGKAAAKAARGAPLAPQQQQQRGVHLLPQAGGGAALRAVERADYEQRLGEHKQENARLREQLDRYKKKLVGMHKAAWEGAENPSASPHAGVPGHTPAPAQGGGGAAARAAVPLRPRPEGGGTSAALELAQEREHAARRDWLQAAKPHVRFDEAGGGEGEIPGAGARSAPRCPPWPATVTATMRTVTCGMTSVSARRSSQGSKLSYCGKTRAWRSSSSR